IPPHGLIRVAKELNFHLLKLATAKNVVSRIDLVAESLANLRDAEGQLKAITVADVLEVSKYALRRFWAKVGNCGSVFERADKRLEHKIENARRGQLAFLVLSRRLTRLQRASHSGKLIGPKTSFASFRLAIDHRIGESLYMPARLPHSRVLDNRAIEP